MQNGVVRNVLATLVVAMGVAAIGLGLGACGGDEAPRRAATDWRPGERLPNDNQHWWGVNVERYCAEDTDCRSGERCRMMRLGTCPRCPAGEEAKVCVNGEGQAVRDLDTAEPGDEPTPEAAPSGESTADAQSPNVQRPNIQLGN